MNRTSRWLNNACSTLLLLASLPLSFLLLVPAKLVWQRPSFTAVAAVQGLHCWPLTLPSSSLFFQFRLDLEYSLELYRGVVHAQELRGQGRESEDLGGCRW